MHVIIIVRNEVAKVMFLQASVCPQGGVPDQEQPPRSRHPPPPSSRQPLGLDTLPRPGTPPGADTTPPDQVLPPGTRYTPWDQVHPPGTRYTPLEPGAPYESPKSHSR